MPFYHGSDHVFKEGETVTHGWSTRSRLVASLYGQHVYEVEPHPNREAPEYGGHTIIKKVERNDEDELAHTDTVGRWELDKTFSTQEKPWLSAVPEW